MNGRREIEEGMGPVAAGYNFEICAQMREHGRGSTTIASGRCDGANEQHRHDRLGKTETGSDGVGFGGRMAGGIMAGRALARRHDGIDV